MANHALSKVEGFQRRSDLFRVDPRVIVVKKGWNTRTDFSGERELADSIIAVGVRRPLLVKKNKDNLLELVDGERRLRATLKGIKEGAEIKSVPVILAKKGTNEVDLCFESIISNTGKPLTSTEEAAFFKRLVAWGISIREIAQKTGRSESHVRNRLELSNATLDVKKAVEDKEISIKDAQEIVRESDGEVAKQSASLKEKKETPKKKRSAPLKIFFKDGSVCYSGGKKDQLCEPLADLMLGEMLKNEIFIEDLVKIGFDPDSIIVTIKEKGLI